MMDYQSLLAALPETPLAPRLSTLPGQIQAGLSEQRYGDLPGWKQALMQMPLIKASQVDLQTGVSIGGPADCDDSTRAQLRSTLESLLPWRKARCHFHLIQIDTKWRAEKEWDGMQE